VSCPWLISIVRATEAAGLALRSPPRHTWADTYADPAGATSSYERPAGPRTARAGWDTVILNQQASGGDVIVARSPAGLAACASSARTEDPTIRPRRSATYIASTSTPPLSARGSADRPRRGHRAPGRPWRLEPDPMGTRGRFACPAFSSASAGARTEPAATTAPPTSAIGSSSADPPPGAAKPDLSGCSRAETACRTTSCCVHPHRLRRALQPLYRPLQNAGSLNGITCRSRRTPDGDGLALAPDRARSGPSSGRPAPAGTRFSRSSSSEESGRLLARPHGPLAGAQHVLHLHAEQRTRLGVRAAPAQPGEPLRCGGGPR